MGELSHGLIISYHFKNHKQGCVTISNELAFPAKTVSFISRRRKITAMLVLNVSVPRNRNALFVPLQKILKGEQRIERVSGEISPNFPAIGGFIPGHQLQLDTKSWKWKLIDRITLPEFRELRDTIERQGRANERTVGNGLEVEEPEEGMVGEHDRATWMHWIKRAVDTGRMRIESGTLPTDADVAKLGTVNLSVSGDGGFTQKEGTVPFDKIIPPSSEKKTATAAKE